MATVTFDTHAYVKKLKSAGFTEQQAEAQSEAQKELLSEILDSTLATKGDIQILKAEIEKVKADIEKAKFDVIKWVAGMLAAQAAVVATLIKLL